MTFSCARCEPRGGYFAYPAGSNVQTTCSAPTGIPNRANCNAAVDALTDVAAYTGSASPYGTFDQGGNVREWNEQISSGGFRSVRGVLTDGAASATAAPSPAR
jgi:formylglycine-generating enzyme required for sulfatase activity